MTARSRYHIVVVGAGIAGLATAAALHRLGHRVTVLEQRDNTSSGAGISIWPNALAALDQIGLGDHVRAAGGRITAGAMRRYDGTWLRHPAPERITTALGEPLVVVGRSVLRDILEGALDPASLRYGTPVVAARQSAEAVHLELSDGSTLSGDAVVGADGTHSTLARSLNGPLAHRYTGYTAWRGVAEFDLDSDLAGETMGPGVEVGHVPMGPGRTYWFAAHRAPEGARSTGGELDHLRGLLSRWADPIPALLAATAAEQVLRNDLYDRAPARRWAHGRVVLVGDAAHPMRPHLGQGGCQGIEDAAVLAHLLAAHGDPPAAFARFQAARQPRVRALVRESRLIGRAVNLRPAGLSDLMVRATVLIPEWAMTRHLAAIAGRAAFRLP
jgi:2-polyprenyl-6-methoxyphenol hydroxylase-like FAD-dependent oxidoreductase